VAPRAAQARLAANNCACNSAEAIRVCISGCAPCNSGECCSAERPWPPATQDSSPHIQPWQRIQKPVQEFATAGKAHCPAAGAGAQNIQLE
jgi:hypothetical protein